MTAPGNVSASKLAGDYLADLTHVALRYLPKGDRAKFVGRTKALIERRCGPLAEAEPNLVAAVLAELGEPRELVMRERERLDTARARRRSPSQAAPWEQRPITSRWRPATGDRLNTPRPGRLRGGKRARPDASAGPSPAAGQDAAAPGAAPAHAPSRWGGRFRARRRASTDPGTEEWTQPMPAEDWVMLGKPGGGAAGQDAAAQDAAGQELASSALAGDVADPRRDPAGHRADQAGEDTAAGPGAELAAIEPTSVVPPDRPPLPPVWAGAVAPGPPTIPGLTLPDGTSSAIVPAAGSPGALTPWTPAGLATLAKGNRREALAVILLALGALLPLPFWPLGAAVAGFSRFWAARYRWVALYGPVLVTLLLTIPLAAIAGGRGNAVAAYVHMIFLDARWLARIGCILTAAYLTWLVRRGPRERIPPWRR